MRPAVFNFRRLLVLAITLTLSAATLSAAERDSLKLFTIGNSFADYPLSYLPALAKAGGKTLVIGRANPGGCSLERHALYLAQAEANDPAGRVYPAFGALKTGQTTLVTLPEALSADKWDIVTIQQWSQQSYKPETYHPAVDQIIAGIRKYAPQAEIVIQETWAYRDDHNFFHKDDGFTPEKMHQGLRAAYHQLAADTGFRIIPTGDAIELARQTPRWTYVPDKNFDYKNPPSGRLPDEPTSLHAGWSWRKNKDGSEKLNLDGIHLSTAGKYLAGAVWYQTLFNTDQVPTGYLPAGLTTEDAADLRGFADAAVKAERLRVVVPAATR
jgi:lysophospholipase L1-like esterase